MPITRAKASSLLNQREMALYDDSRANALRQLDPKTLQNRITRARSLRDRARDLLQRQSQQARQRGTADAANARTAQKHELLSDVLQRFETQHDRQAPQPSASDPVNPPKARKATNGKASGNGSASRRAAEASPAVGRHPSANGGTAARVRHNTAVDVQQAEDNRVAKASRGAAAKASRNSPAATRARSSTGKAAVARADRGARGSNAAGVQAQQDTQARQAAAGRDASKTPPGGKDTSRTGALRRGSSAGTASRRSSR